MADQETQVIEPHVETDRAEPGLRASVADFVHDVLTLLELQWQLVVDDASRWARRSLGACILAAAGALAALSTLPVLMAGIAHLLAEAGLPLSWALLLTGIAVAVVGLVCLYAGWRWLLRSVSAFDRSRAELRANVAWLKHTLKDDRGGSADRRARA